MVFVVMLIFVTEDFNDDSDGDGSWDSVDTCVMKMTS